MRMDNINTILVSLFMIATASSSALAQTGPQPAATPIAPKSIFSLATLVSYIRDVCHEDVWLETSIAEDKVLLDQKPSSFASLKRTLAALPGYHWMEGKRADDSSFWVLCPDWGERLQWKSVTVKQESERGAAEIEKQKMRLKEYFDALSLSQEDLAKLQNDDPWIASTLMYSNTRAAISFLSSLPAGELDMVFNNANSGNTFGVATIPFDIQVEFATWLHYEADSKIWKPSFDTQEIEDRLLSEGKLSFGATREGLEMAISLPGGGTLGETLVRPKDMYPESARWGIRVRGGMPLEQANALKEKEAKASAKQRTEARQTATKERVKQTPPRFGSCRVPDVKVNLDTGKLKTYEMLSSVCHQAKLGFVAQYFENRDKQFPQSLRGEKRLVDALDYFAEQAGFLWGYQDGYVVVTSRYLVDDLDAEIPMSLLDKWRGMAVKSGGRMTFANLVEISSDPVSDLQLAHMPQDLYLTGAALALYYRPHLQLYASLTQAQRQIALSADGLPYNSLSTASKALMDASIVRGAVSALPRETHAQNLRIAFDGAISVFTYVLNRTEPVTVHIRARSEKTADAGFFRKQPIHTKLCRNR